MIYLADDLACALAEAFPEQWPEVAICPRRCAILAAPRSPVTLLDLTGNGAMRIGALSTLGSGDEPRRLTQRWARAIYEDLPVTHGVRYRGAHQGGIAVAVWERAGPLQAFPGTTPPADALAAPPMLARVSVALAAQGRYPTVITARDCPYCP